MKKFIILFVAKLMGWEEPIKAQELPKGLNYYKIKQVKQNNGTFKIFAQPYFPSGNYLVKRKKDLAIVFGENARQAKRKYKKSIGL